MPIEYTIEDELVNAVTDIVANEEYDEFDLIREQQLAFLVAFKIKTTNEGEFQPTTGPAVIIRKVGPADKVFLQGHMKIYVCKTRWDAANELQQKAMLHRALMRINIEIKDSGVKINMRKPDVETFQRTILRFGAWEEELIQLRNNLQTAQRLARETAKGTAKETARQTA